MGVFRQDCDFIFKFSLGNQGIPMSKGFTNFDIGIL